MRVGGLNPNTIRRPVQRLYPVEFNDQVTRDEQDQLSSYSSGSNAHSDYVSMTIPTLFLYNYQSLLAYCNS